MVSTVSKVIPEIIAKGGDRQAQSRSMNKPRLGINMGPEALSQRFGIDGVVVLDVIQDSPADKAGLKPVTQGRDGEFRMGDVIVSLNDQKVESGQELVRLLQDADQKLTLGVVRNGKPIKVPVDLD